MIIKDNFSDLLPVLDTKEVQAFDYKRIYVNIKNIENKNLIGFKTDKVTIPFKIIKTDFDESNTIFVNNFYKFTLSKNKPLLFVKEFNKNQDLFIKFTSNIDINYFNNINYFAIQNEFLSFSCSDMNKFNENVYKMFNGKNKIIIYKRIYGYNYYGMYINQTKDGEILFEFLDNFNELNGLIINDDIPYNLKSGINLIKTNLCIYNQYFFILKYENNISPNNIELFGTNNYYPQTNISNIYNFKIDIKKDNTYTYYFFDFIYQPSLIIFSNAYCPITIRQSRHKENDFLNFII